MASARSLVKLTNGTRLRVSSSVLSTMRKLKRRRPRASVDFLMRPRRRGRRRAEKRVREKQEDHTGVARR